MHPTDPLLAAAQAIYDISVSDLRSSLAGFGVDGINWKPEAPETNSAAVLASHAMGSARDWVCLALDTQSPPRVRADEFLSRFDSEDQALALVDAIRSDTLRVFDQAAVPDWSVVVPGVGEDGDPPTTRAYCLLHALEHLREHVAHLQLTRQLWDARKDA